VPRIGLPRERAQDLAYALGSDQGGEAGVGVSRVVINDGEVARALADQGVDQGGRHPCIAEAADHDGGAIRDVGQGSLGAGDELVDHSGANYGTHL